MAITTLQVDENNDLFLPDGRNLGVLTGVDALAQDLKLAGLMRTGEDIYDTTNGVDYLGTIFTPQVNYDLARASISNAILKKPDVLSIKSLVLTIGDNVFSYTADVSTIYGNLTTGN
jgi:hypothetical protein